jgi:hypothetical protein
MKLKNGEKKKRDEMKAMRTGVRTQQQDDRI